MNSRWISIALIAIGLVALAAFVASNSSWEEVTLPAPLRGEAVTNPFYASQKFAEALGATTQWRHSLGELPSGDVVVVLSHWHWDLLEARRQQLEDWVSAGGRIVVDRTLIGGGAHLESWAGIRREYFEHEEEEEEEGEETETQSNTTDAPPQGEGALASEFCNGSLRAVDAQGNITVGREYSVCKLDAFSHLVTDRDIAWGLASHRGIQALRVNVGRGSVTSINAVPFGNRDLLDEDHGALFVAATQLRRDDLVIFVSERDHPSLLRLIWMYGAPVVVLFFIMLAALLWRGGIRFGPLSGATETARRSIAEQIRGTGQFTIRLGGGKALHAAAVRALQEAARRKIIRYADMPHDERIAAIARATDMDADTLLQAINHSGPRRPAELAHTVATLEAARRRILDESVRPSSNSQPGA